MSKEKKTESPTFLDHYHTITPFIRETIIRGYITPDVNVLPTGEKNQRNRINKLKFLEDIAKEYDVFHKNLPLKKNKVKLDVNRNYILESQNLFFLTYRLKSVTAYKLFSYMTILRFLENNPEDSKENRFNTRLADLIDDLSRGIHENSVEKSDGKDRGKNIQIILDSLVDNAAIEKDKDKYVSDSFIQQLNDSIDIDRFIFWLNTEIFQSPLSVIPSIFLDKISCELELDCDFKNSVTSKHHHFHPVSHEVITENLFLASNPSSPRYITIIKDHTDSLKNLMPLKITQNLITGNFYIIVYDEKNIQSNYQTIPLSKIKEIKLDLPIDQDFFQDQQNKITKILNECWDIPDELDPLINSPLKKVSADFYIDSQTQYIINRLNREKRNAKLNTIIPNKHYYFEIHVLNPESMASWFNSFTGYCLIHASESHHLKEIVESNWEVSYNG